MFHCNGWGFPWSISVVGGTHVTLRGVRAKAIWQALAEHKVTHLCGAPIVMATILNAPDEDKPKLPHVVEFPTAAAPPPEIVLARMAEAGFNVTHLYGLTETYGPAVVNDWDVGMGRADLRPSAPPRKRARASATSRSKTLTVMDPETMKRVPADGETLGEVMFRGNIVMKGYLKNRQASEEAFKGGWFHSGDLGVLHRRRLYPAQGPLQGHHHLGRREHLLDRGRGRALQAPGGAGRRRRRQGGREMGRDALRLHRAEARPEARRQRRSSNGAARVWPASRCRSMWCSPNCRRPGPARSRNSSCVRWRRRSDLRRLVRKPQERDQEKWAPIFRPITRQN